MLLACALLAACSNHLAVEVDDHDAGPCGRGKARSCACDDGQRGIAQCLVGGDWGDCFCADPRIVDAGQPVPDAGTRDARSVPPPAPVPACDQPYELRAHAASGLADPYLIRGGGLLGATNEQTVCFYFKPPYAEGSEAYGFVALPDEVSQPDSWLLYGIDNGAHADGEVLPCSHAEAGSYLLAGFTPGSDDITMPTDVGLQLPGGASAGLVLELHYGTAGPVELLDRTGVRICAAAAGTRAHQASVQITGSEAVCIPPGAMGYELAGVCSPRVDQGSIHLLSVSPRMLKLGTRMQVTIQRRDGSSEPLYDELQRSALQVHYLNGKATLEPGDTLKTRCFYDNPSVFQSPYGGDSGDSLCYAFINSWPAGALAVDALLLDPIRNFNLGTQNTTRRCLDPIGILGSCL